MNRKSLTTALLVLVLALLSCGMMSVLRSRSRVSGITRKDLQGEAFRAQQLTGNILKELQKESAENITDILTVSMLMGHYQPERLYRDNRLLLCYKEEEYQLLYRAYRAIWKDVEVFPVAIAEEIRYTDTWLTPRSYGGDRRHEGCDLFGPEDISGVYPIVSMTDGTVEQVGWLPLGGYRIGIRSSSDGYFYYAHLASYDRSFRPGDGIQSGDILGYMGDTGYGREKTTGKFPVHLHMGIYIRTEDDPEISVNPYWILRYSEKNRIKYAY